MTPAQIDLARVRIDLGLIADMVAPGSRVLDIGCGDGALMELLQQSRDADARGLELSQAGVNACVARGLSVIQGDADTDLAAYPDGGFDYVILSQTLQATHRPAHVVSEMLRIGQKAIVSFPNFGHWKVRLNLLLRGRMPETETLDQPWYDTPNIHLCTVRDFYVLTQDSGISVDQAIMLSGTGKARTLPAGSARANLLAEQAIFLLSKN